MRRRTLAIRALVEQSHAGPASGVDAGGRGFMTHETVHTMPLEALRARAREAQRLIAEARAIARSSFEAVDSRGAADEAAHRVGSLLDAAQHLLPGMTPLA